MLRIRLRRMGKKKQPSYRIVVADSHSPRDGAFVEILGHYHPLDDPSTIVLDGERARHWLDRGAQPSDRVAKILAIEGLREIPAKLQTRIALGQQRAKDAAKAKPKAEVEEAPAAAAPAEAEAPSEEAPVGDEQPAEAEAPGEEAPVGDEQPAEAEAPGDEAPVGDEQPAEAEAPSEEAPASDEQPAEPEAAADGEEKPKA